MVALHYDVLLRVRPPGGENLRLFVLVLLWMGPPSGDYSEKKIEVGAPPLDISPNQASCKSYDARFGLISREGWTPDPNFL